MGEERLDAFLHETVNTRDVEFDSIAMGWMADRNTIYGPVYFNTGMACYPYLFVLLLMISTSKF